MADASAGDTQAFVVVTPAVFDEPWTISQIAAEALPWTMTGLATVPASGVVLAISDANRLYHSNPFMITMDLFVVALIFTLTFQLPLNRAEPLAMSAHGAPSLSLLL
ncbi:MAG TPA: hypothetical protein VGR73_02480 [Bryobacteraceae bacterium]|nr:hypothetical protein [Bryobacteraceae bacterium]